MRFIGWLTALVSDAKIASFQPSDGLVAYWPGEGNANDIVGGNHGTLRGGATFATGVVGQAFSFDGVDDGFTASSTGLPTGSSDRSIDFWLNSPNMAVGNRFLLGWGNPATAQMSSITIGLADLPTRKAFFWGFFCLSLL